MPNKYVIRAFGSTLIINAKDISQRLRLASFQSLPLRLRLASQPILTNIAQRVRLSAVVIGDIRQRLIVQSVSRQDYVTRLRLIAGTQYKDIHTRTTISSAILSSDIKMRFVLSPYHNANILLFPVLRPMI